MCQLYWYVVAYLNYSYIFPTMTPNDRTHADVCRHRLHVVCGAPGMGMLLTFLFNKCLRVV